MKLLILKVKQIRLKKGYTVRKLSELSGISIAEVSRVESGARRPTIDTLYALAKAMEVSILDTFEPIPDKGPS